MHRKKLVSIKEIPKEGRHLLFIDEEFDDIEIHDIDIRRSLFVRLGLKRAKFSGCHLTQNIFEDCYLREAKFKNVDFSGSFFKDCNLQRATFHSCILRYMRFNRCIIDYDEILGSLPSEPDLRLQMLNSLKQNAIEMGHKTIADKLLLQVIQAEKEELKNRFLLPTSYYKERYDNLSLRVGAFFKWLVMLIDGLLWGYGLKPIRLIISALVTIILVAIIMTMFNLQYFYNNQITQTKNISFFEALYVSAITFGIGMGGYVPATIASQVVSVIERFVGVVFLGFLVATIYRRIAR